MNVILNLSWTVTCKGHTKIWLPLPIQNFHQKVIQISKPKGIKKDIKSKLFHYWYLETNNQMQIQTNVKLRLNNISKYKDDTKVSRFLSDNNLLLIKKIKSFASKFKSPKEIYTWIIENIKFPKDLSKYLKNLNWAESAYAVFKKRTGECAGKSLLFVACCRAIRIPARIVNGYFLKEGEIALFDSKFNERSLELHHWAEFYDGNFWVPVDCSLAQENKKEFFGTFDDYRVIISKDMNFKLYNDDIVPFLQIGELKPKNLKNANLSLKLEVRKDGRSRF